MFIKIVKLMTAIQNFIADITMFNIICIIMFFLWEIIWVAPTTGLIALGLMFCGFTLETSDLLVFFIVCLLVDILIPPMASYHSFKRQYILYFLVWVYKKRHFPSNNNIDDLANYYLNLGYAVLQKYYKSDHELIEVCIVDKIRKDNLSEETEIAICRKLEILERYNYAKKFDKIYEKYKNACMNLIELSHDMESILDEDKEDDDEINNVLERIGKEVPKPAQIFTWISCLLFLIIIAFEILAMLNR